jgi:hypothetical protein
MRSRRPLARWLGFAVGLGLALPAGALASARLAGNVLEVDETKREVTIIDAGKRHTFSYGEQTIIRRGSTNQTAADLRRGDRIIVSLANPDGLEARLIAIAGPPYVPRRRDLSLP